MSGATDEIRPLSPTEGTTAKMAQASSLFAPEDETNGDVEMINISHKVCQKCYRSRSRYLGKLLNFFSGMVSKLETCLTSCL